ASAREPGRVRLTPAGDGAGSARALGLLASSAEGPGRIGRGSYHHVALEVEDDEALEAARARVRAGGVPPTQGRARTYFTCVCCPGPGGGVIELAAGGPAMTADEPLEELGRAFKLPAWLEPERQAIRAQLPVTASPEYTHLYR